MLRSLASEKNEQIKEMHDFIERQKEDNREIELNNKESEKNVFKLKQEYKNLEQMNLDMAAEVYFYLFIWTHCLHCSTEIFYRRLRVDPGKVNIRISCYLVDNFILYYITDQNLKII